MKVDKTHPIAAPLRCEFSHTETVIVDVFETHYDEGSRHGWLSIVCSGTCFHQVIHVAEEGGVQPASSKCLEFSRCVASWAGLPKVVRANRVRHNGGAFSRGLSDRGTAGLEGPEHIGRGERQGGIVN